MSWEALPSPPAVSSLGAMRLVSAVLSRRPMSARLCLLGVRLPTRRLLPEYIQVPLIGIPLPPSDLRSTDHEVGHNQDDRNEDQQEDKVSVPRAVAQELLSRAIMWMHLSRAFTTPSGAPSPSAMVRCPPRDGNVRSEISTKGIRPYLDHLPWSNLARNDQRLRTRVREFAAHRRRHQAQAAYVRRWVRPRKTTECRFDVKWIWSVQHHAHPPRDVL
jgi:hypothetical protein